MKPISLKFENVATGMFWAGTPFGPYRVFGGKKQWNCMRGIDHLGKSPFATKRDAIAAAQRDFEERLGRCYE